MPSDTSAIGISEIPGKGWLAHLSIGLMKSLSQKSYKTLCTSIRRDGDRLIKTGSLDACAHLAGSVFRFGPVTNKREWKYRRPVTCADETGNEGEQFGNVTALKVVTTNNR